MQVAGKQAAKKVVKQQIKKQVKKQVKKQIKKKIKKKIMEKIKKRIKEKIKEKIKDKVMEKVMNKVDQLRAAMDEADEELYLMEGLLERRPEESEWTKTKRRMIGFVCGCLLIYVLYLLLVVAMGYQSSTAVIICGVLGFATSFGLAFSTSVRCITLLILPSLFAGKGRTMLIAYGFVLVFSGPMMNLSHNMDVAGRSQACGCALALNQSHTIFEIMTAPLSSIIDDLEVMIKKVQRLVREVLDSVNNFARAIRAVVREIKKFFKWLRDALETCQETLARPEQLCRETFETAEANCRNRVSVVIEWACGISGSVGKVCAVAGVIQIGCIFHMAVNFIANKVSEAFGIAVNNIEEELYVRISFQHRFNLDADFSKTLNDITMAILEEVDQRTKIFQEILGCVGFVMSFSAILIILKALKYRRNYLTKDSFDNWCITKEFRTIEERRKEMQKPTLLPLKAKERQKYKYPTPKEKRKLNFGIMMWATNAGYAAIVIIADFCAYSFLSIVRTHAELRVQQQDTGSIHLVVDGNGFLAKVYRLLTTTMDPSHRVNMTIDTTKCLPDASPPDQLANQKIVLIFAFCFFLILTESYGLRIRRFVAAYYYPARERERAVWLYNHILRKRGTFMEFLWQRVKQIPFGASEPVSFRSRLAAKSKICRFIFKYLGYEMIYCVCCGHPGKPDDNENFRHCENAGCTGVFCLECVMDINGVCTQCMNPVEYDNDFNIDFERDSSEDEFNEVEAQK